MGLGQMVLQVVSTVFPMLSATADDSLTTIHDVRGLPIETETRERTQQSKWER